MKKYLNTSTITIVLLLAVFITMSVGFAVFAQTLNINGTAVAKQASWKVQFKDNTYAESTGSVAASDTSLNVTSMTYSVTLNPGQFYEFSVDVENAGTFDAVLKSITLSDLTSEQKNYINYTLTYDGTTYSATTSNLSLDLTAGSTKTVKVKIEYVIPEDPTKLPTTSDVTLNLSASLDYLQKA
jgi:type 1 fimbria pilin